jgi:hypothetical protein
MSSLKGTGVTWLCSRSSPVVHSWGEQILPRGEHLLHKGGAEFLQSKPQPLRRLEAHGPAASAQCSILPCSLEQPTRSSQRSMAPYRSSCLRIGTGARECWVPPKSFRRAQPNPGTVLPSTSPRQAGCNLVRPAFDQDQSAFCGFWKNSRLDAMEETVAKPTEGGSGTALIVGADRFLARCRDWWEGRDEVSRCFYCGSTAFGANCSSAPRGVHQHQTDYRHCEYCGSTAYGLGCSYSPTHIHHHGGGGRRCRWCGSRSTGIDCSYYPTGVHEHSPSSERVPLRKSDE